MIIWILDCCSGCVTMVKLSAEREREYHERVEVSGEYDLYGFIKMYEDDFGVRTDDSSYMVTANEYVFEVDF